MLFSRGITAHLIFNLDFIMWGFSFTMNTVWTIRCGNTFFFHNEFTIMFSFYDIFTIECDIISTYNIVFTITCVMNATMNTVFTFWHIINFIFHSRFDLANHYIITADFIRVSEKLPGVANSLFILQPFDIMIIIIQIIFCITCETFTFW